MSTASEISWRRVRMKVAMSAKRGTTAGSVGWKSACPGMGPLAEMNRVRSRRADVVSSEPRRESLPFKPRGEPVPVLSNEEASLESEEVRDGIPRSRGRIGAFVNSTEVID